ncbi:MAG: tetratricopeptide repeat protein [Myxococcota bacterium]|nr:tetratricopeptide repeat protein [Myxococcota bacterium]
MPDDDQKSDDKPHVGAGEEVASPGDAREDAREDGPADAFRPEAIAARIDRIGEETDLERIANEEERKLAARRREGASKGKSGLEAAASKRLSQIGEVKVTRPSTVAGASSIQPDPLLDRATQVSQWIRGHRELFGGLVAVVLLGLGGTMSWTYWQAKHEAQASALLAQAFADEHGHVSAKDADDEDDGKAKPLYPTFKSVAERREAALATFRQVESRYAGMGAAILARLAEAGLLLDKGDAAPALAAYEDVKASPLARADMEVKGRSLEGVGFAHELLAERDGASREKHLDEALAAYKELEHLDAKGFKELAMYHQARVLEDKGDDAKATELLKDVSKRVKDPGESHSFAYLESVVDDRLRQLDPSALPPRPSRGTGGGGRGAAGGMGGPGGPDMNDPQIQELLRQLKQQKGNALPHPAPGGSP